MLLKLEAEIERGYLEEGLRERGIRKYAGLEGRWVGKGAKSERRVDYIVSHSSQFEGLAAVANCYGSQDSYSAPSEGQRSCFGHATRELECAAIGLMRWAWKGMRRRANYISLGGTSVWCTQGIRDRVERWRIPQGYHHASRC
jgi:hypothetical protein